VVRFTTPAISPPNHSKEEPLPLPYEAGTPQSFSKRRDEEKNLYLCRESNAALQEVESHSADWAIPTCDDKSSSTAANTTTTSITTTTVVVVVVVVVVGLVIVLLAALRTASILQRMLVYTINDKKK
jgi:hypothetical protein